VEQKTERQCPMGMPSLLRPNESYLGVRNVWEIELLPGSSTQRPFISLGLDLKLS